MLVALFVILLCFLLPMRHNQSINFGYTLAYRKNCMICIWVQSYEKYLIFERGVCGDCEDCFIVCLLYIYSMFIIYL